MPAREKSCSAKPPKSAVEKAGAWEPAKTKSRFPPAPTLPWKSRPNREIPTFPPRRLRLLFCPKGKQRPKPKPKRRRPKGRIALFHKADGSRINKTGQLDLLTTGPLPTLPTADMSRHSEKFLIGQSRKFLL